MMPEEALRPWRRIRRCPGDRDPPLTPAGRTSIPLTLNPRAGGLPPAFSFSLEVRRVVVLSYNIHHGVGCDGILDLERIAGVIESVSPDVVGLNEVDVRFHRRSGWVDQLGWLARRLGMACRFGPTLLRQRAWEPAAGGYGNALLTKDPILHHQSLTFSADIGEPRGILVADLEREGRLARLIVTHLGLTSSMRRRQVEAIRGICGKWSGPMVVMGDWNVTPDQPEVTGLSPRLTDVLSYCGVAGGTYPCRRPRKRIDYIFCSPHFRILEASIVPVEDCPSDHLPVQCRLDWSNRVPV